MLKILLALLVGTLAYSFTLLRRIEASFVPDLGVSARRPRTRYGR